MNTTTTTTTKMGFKAHQKLVSELMQKHMMLEMERHPDVELTQDFFADLMLHPEFVEAALVIDHELYIQEYVVWSKEHLAELGATTRSEAESLLTAAEISLAETLGQARYEKTKATYGELTQRCYDALYASYPV